MLTWGALAERLRDEVLVRERDHGHSDARHPAEFGGEHAARVDDDLGLDLAPLGLDAADAADRGRRSPRTRVCVNTPWPPWRAPSTSA